MRRLRDIRLAFALLTGVPVPVDPPEAGRPSFAAAWFPLVGVVLGAVPACGLIGVAQLNERLDDGLFTQRSAFLLGAVVVGFWAWATRMLHWDGLGDVADAVWGGDTPPRRLEIMADSRVGGFGAAAIALVALVEAAAVGVIASAGYRAAWALLAAPVVGRLSASFAATLGKPARGSGLGRSVSVAGRDGLAALAVAAATTALAWLPALVAAGSNHAVPAGGGVAMATVALASTAVAASVPHALAGFFGGVTGDVMGASILLTETATLVLAALVGAW